MGASGSRAPAAPSGDTTTALAASEPRADAIFDVTPVRGFASFSAPVRVRLGAETLSILSLDGAVVISWPYHRILCWGFTDAYFSWRVAPLSAEATEEAAAAAAADLLKPDDSAPAAFDSFVVATSAGRALEAALMGAVRRLLGSMRARGVGAAEFAALVAALPALAADGLTEHALDALKQMALGRAFDARQAAALLSALGTVSPFDKIEAACALWPDALLHAEALPAVLADAFDDPLDRENVLHRLGLTVTEAGGVAAAPTVTSRAAAKTPRK
jgi:hypothetical protein